MLLSDKGYFNIVLPRVPVLINREILKKVGDIPEKRNRLRENQSKSRDFKKGMIIQALSKRDHQWNRAKILGIHYQSMNPVPSNNDEDLEDELADDEDVPIVRKL